MKRLTKEEVKLMAKLLTEYMDLKPAVDRYYEVSKQYDKLAARQMYWERTDKFNKIRTKCYYEEPEYPSMGCLGSYGCALLITEEDANALIDALREESNYYHGYKMEWSGPGNYTVKPTYKRDHDGEIIYTATFNKLNGDLE